MSNPFVWAALIVLLAVSRAWVDTGQLEQIQRTMSSGDYGLALEQANQALERAPSDPSLLAVKRDLLWEMGQTDAALQVAESLLELDPAHRSRHRRFVLEYRLRKKMPVSILELYDNEADSAASDLEAL